MPLGALAFVDRPLGANSLASARIGTAIAVSPLPFVALCAERDSSSYDLWSGRRDGGLADQGPLKGRLKNQRNSFPVAAHTSVFAPLRTLGEIPACQHPFLPHQPPSAAPSSPPAGPRVWRVRTVPDPLE
jgi:hypothetical protein